MKNDILSVCPCERKSDACYTQEITENVTIKQCFGCGFQCNSLMKETEEFFTTQMEMLPELYKDIMWKDDQDIYWTPSTVTIPTRGTAFINGTNKDNWEWVAMLAAPVTTKEDKEKYKKKDGTPYEYRMDSTTMKAFGKNGYIDALDYIRVFDQE